MQLNGLKQFNGVLCFPISWIALHEFNPEQVRNALHGIKPSINPAMLKGIHAHSKLFQEFKEKALEKDSMQNILQKSIDFNQTFSSREVFVFSSQLRIFGKIDEIVLSKNSIQVIDDKTSTKLYKGHQLQVLAYALCFQSQFSPLQEIECLLRNTDSKQEIWKDKLTDSHKELVLEKIKQILELIEEENNEKSILKELI
ncbi:MAG: Dna2/Cas4 domain-containing protein [archaeon]|nr:Dna2/Cas4 domain-containing protein [archaeon]